MFEHCIEPVQAQRQSENKNVMAKGNPRAKPLYSQLGDFYFDRMLSNSYIFIHVKCSKLT